MSERLDSNKPENNNYDHRWDNLGKVDVYKTGEHVVVFGEQNETERKKKETERQERKIISVLLTGDTDIISEHDVEDFDTKSYDEFFERRQNGEISDEDEASLLEQIQTPDKKVGAAVLAEKMSYNKHMAKILHRFSKDNGSEYQWINGRNIDSFMEQYPTPFAFEKKKDVFLGQIKANNSEHKYQEYVRDMDKFQHEIYGKRFEYYNVLKGLDAKMESRIENNKDLSEMIPLPIGELDVDKPDLAVYSCSRSETKGGEPGMSEDSFYESEDSGILAIFDGAGGEANAREASQAACRCLESFDTSYRLENVHHLANIVMRMNDAVVKTGGFSTGIMAKIHNDGGDKSLDFVNVGDSRLYLVRGGEAHQLSHDEGEGNRISNYLGKTRGFSINDWGENIKLKKGDRLLLCSDGVTGDWKEDSLSREDIAKLVNSGNTPAEATRNCVLGAKKKDDRTAIVKFID